MENTRKKNLNVSIKVALTGGVPNARLNANCHTVIVADP